MRKILFLLLVVCISNAYGQNKSFDYCYTNSKGICVYSVADKAEYLVVSPNKGSDPCISPDGTKLAYTANLPNGDRNIAVIDLTTNHKKVLSTDSKNCYGPMWSPDGQYIAYNVFNTEKSNWSIAIIDAANTGYKVLTAQLEQSYMPTWQADSKSVVVQNMDTVFIFDLEGNIITTYKVADMDRGVSVLQDAGPSSSDRFVFTNDGKKIVFSSEANEPGGSDGPPTAVFVYNTESRSTLRLSPKGYFAGGVFIKGDKVLFTASKLKSNTQNVYIVDMDGKNMKILFPNCADISAKN
jgi:TolB protein